MDLTINNVLSFFVAKTIIKTHIKHETIGLFQFYSYLPRLTALVEKKILIFPEKFSLVFEGWTSGLANFLPVFDSLSTSNVNGYDTRLLTS